MAELQHYLSFMDEDARRELLAAYTARFDAAGEAGEAALLEQLGTPMKISIALRRGEAPTLPPLPETGDAPAEPAAAAAPERADPEPEAALEAAPEAADKPGAEGPLTDSLPPAGDAETEAPAKPAEAAPPEEADSPAGEAAEDASPEETAAPAAEATEASPVPEAERPEADAPAAGAEAELPAQEAEAQPSPEAAAEKPAKSSPLRIVGSILLEILLAALGLVVLAAAGFVGLVGLALIDVGARNLSMISDGLMFWGAAGIAYALAIVILGLALWLWIFGTRRLWASLNPTRRQHAPREGLSTFWKIIFLLACIALLAGVVLIVVAFLSGGNLGRVLGIWREYFGRIDWAYYRAFLGF